MIHHRVFWTFKPCYVWLSNCSCFFLLEPVTQVFILKSVTGNAIVKLWYSLYQTKIVEFFIQFYYPLCQGIIFTHGVRVGVPAGGGKKFQARLYLRNYKV